MADIEKINATELVSAELLNDLRLIIDSARSHVAATANYEVTMMYWHIGNRINTEVLSNERAAYGKQIVSQVATQLTELYGKDFSSRNLHRMVQFSQLFPNEEIVSTRRHNCRTRGATIVKPSLSDNYPVCVAKENHPTER